MTSIFILTGFLLIVAIGIIMLVLVYQKKQLQYLREKEQLMVTYEKEILESKLEIQEQTLKTISQEIHDNIGQVLSLAKLTINTMNCDEPAVMQEKIESSSQLVGKAIQDLRDLSKSLNTDHITKLGLINAIEHEFIIIKKAGNYQTSLTHEGDLYKLSHQHQLILFRLFQEVLNNILKHSKASAVEVNVVYHSPNFILQISDNGNGFDLSKLNDTNTKSNGLGILNMKNRTRLIGADLNIISEPGQGTLVKITLPINETNYA